MSVETITIILGAATLVVTIVGGLFAASAWILRHTAQQMDARFAQADARNDARFDKVDERFDKVDARFEKVDEQFKEVNEQFKEVGTQIRGVAGGAERCQGCRGPSGRPSPAIDSSSPLTWNLTHGPFL